ncbi:hypothetical protein As57867_001434, partial [Aphanomyces stellatus]
MERVEQKLKLARFKRFDPFLDALLRSPPSKLAMATGKLSIGSPSFPLAKAYPSSSTRPVTPPPPATDTISVLLRLQQPDGRWKMDYALAHALHGLVPAVP